MKAKTKTGLNILETNKWDFDKRMIINFVDKWIYKNFYQRDNHLFIDTDSDVIDIVFTGEVPTLAFESYDKDQLILKVI
jgi:hypothetical protein